MRLAFDVHGVLDTHEEYRELMRSMYMSRNYIFIISGQPLDDEMKALLKAHDLDDFYHEYRSVETYLLEEDIHGYEERPEGKFWIDPIWNPVKAKICEDEYIDMIFDNSPSYAAEFAKVATHFNLVIDKEKFNTNVLRTRK